MSRWNVDWWPDRIGVLERFRNGCLKSSTLDYSVTDYSSLYASHETATSYTVKYWYRITCPSLWKHNVYMHIYSRSGAVPVMLSCTDHMFLGWLCDFEHTAQPQAQTQPQGTRLQGQPSFLQIPIVGDTWFITTGQFTSHWPSVSITTLSTVSIWDNVEMARFFLQRTDHMVLENILIFMFCTNASARC